MTGSVRRFQTGQEFRADRVFGGFGASKWHFGASSQIITYSPNKDDQSVI